MRNIKRILAMGLATVMLCASMVTGSMASFNDADKIVNTEAATITTSLGLFVGTTDGNFDPQGTVTRAQMAAVIAKMFYGSDLNADTYKGGNQFSDTTDFEGGWAEGYINLGVEKGWFAGYGDGTFKPGQAVTTAEAVTMLINLLGVDAGAGTWPMTVMATAEDIDLFDLMIELKPAPATNAAMTRDQLAVAVWNALNYSADGVKGYKVIGCDITFKSWSEAAAYADAAYKDSNNNPIWDVSFVTEVREDTLADTVFEIQSVTGFIVDNKGTGEDGTIIGTSCFDIDTDVNDLGHYVTVYYSEEYKNDRNPGNTYCIVEEATYVTVEETITNDKKDYLAVFGTKTDATSLDVKCFDDTDEVYTNSEYRVTYTAGLTAEAGTYVISNETGKIIAFIAPMTYTIETVGRVNTISGKESIRIGNTLYKNTEDEDEIVEYAGIVEDDVVAVKNYNGMIYVEKLEIIGDQKVTKTSTRDDKDYIYLNNVAYETAGVTVNTVDGMIATATPDNYNTYDAYIYNGKLIGLIETEGSTNLSDVIYVVGTYDIETNGTYSKITNYYAQGIDAAGKEVSVLIGVDTLGATADERNNMSGFYTFKKSIDKDAAKKGIMTGTPADEFDTVEEVDNFFVAEVTNTTFTKEDKYVTTGAGRVYLTDDTKFIVVDNATIGDELKITTYTGAIAKDVSSDIIAVAASIDANDNKVAEIVVICTAKPSQKAEDYIYVINNDVAFVGDNRCEYTVFFTSTNEFKTIVTDREYSIGFYGNYEIDEDGIYNLGELKNYDDILTSEIFDSIYGTSSIISTRIDLYDAANAVIVDVRDEDDIEESDVAEIETLKDIVSADKANYKVTFTAIVDTEGRDGVVTHIFITDVEPIVEPIGE